MASFTSGAEGESRDGEGRRRLGISPRTSVTSFSASSRIRASFAGRGPALRDGNFSGESSIPPQLACYLRPRDTKNTRFMAPIMSARFLVAIALTIFFASAVRENDYRAWRKIPSKLFLVAAGSWISGVLIFFLGDVMVRWLPLAAALASFFVIAFSVFAALFRATPQTVAGHASPRGVRATLALYFCATTALLVGTVFARSYVAGLS